VQFWCLLIIAKEISLIILLENALSGGRKLKIVLNIFSRVFIALYAILTLIAVIAEMKEIGFQSIHLLYFIGAILLISATVKNLPWLVYLSLVLMIPLVIFTGYIVGNLQLSHIIIRILITVLLSLIYGCSVR